MNKQKLINYLKDYLDASEILKALTKHKPTLNAIEYKREAIKLLLEATESGYFETEPCDSCGYYEKQNSELLRDEQYKRSDYCRKCGRKMEEVK